jgi:hypothetical protein
MKSTIAFIMAAMITAIGFMSTTVFAAGGIPYYVAKSLSKDCYHEGYTSKSREFDREYGQQPSYSGERAMPGTGMESPAPMGAPGQSFDRSMEHSNGAAGVGTAGY